MTEPTDPVDYVLYCAENYVDEYVSIGSDRRRKFGDGVDQIKEMREDAWKYRELSK